MKKLALKSLAAVAVASMLPPAAWAYYYATTVVGIVSFDCKFSESVTTGYPNPVSVTQEIQQTDNYSTGGTASGQVDTLFAKQYTLAGAPQTLDLTTLTDPAGLAINFARVRELVIQNTTATAGFDLKVSGGAANGVSFLPASTAPIYCRYGSVLRISDRLSTGAGNGNVVDGTHKTILLDPGANTVIVNLMILGGSASLLPGFVLLALLRHRRIRLAA